MINLQAFATDPAAFQAELIIPAAHGPQRFGDCAAEFQRERFAGINPALLGIANGTKPDIGRHWWEATKGASKDSDLAVCLLWLLAFTKRKLACQIGAADQDQADEMRKAAKDILALNPWLDSRIRVTASKIICEATNSVAQILAADTTGSHGARPDVLICNELSHIAKQEFAENLLDNAAKVPHGLVVIATNAGFEGTWQQDWRKIAETSDRWLMNVRDTPSPWLDDAEIEEAQRRNSRARYLRLWHGVWSSGLGDAIDEELIEFAFSHGLKPMTGREPGYKFVGGIDLGVKRDASAFICLAVGKDNTPYRGKIRLAHHRVWIPSPGNKVDLREVQRHINECDLKFRFEAIGFDPWNSELLATNLEAVKKARSDKKFGHGDEAFMREVPPTGANLRDMCTLMIESFNDRRFRFYKCDQLRADLRKLQIEEKQYGSRLVSPRDNNTKGTPHGDLASALAIALLVAHKVSTRKTVVAGGLLSSTNTFADAMSRFESEARIYEEQMAYEPDDRQAEIRPIFNSLRRRY